ncbi:aldose 1-epimerase family protein [Aldersonia sp. NBC_00410]|uniref:aldose 1-epimerase family protein n=1 Tax=Aldersonia sp. NBC_00410 TaxID=2975954 RepID=UPI00225659F6|nr:aldose 1-epimerase family protein [Aldersonia sp. NBC_00410]MCX5045675.1 aldose 1-epimerase family protein [Aldersonia sp. NBC_00410]
MTEQVDTASGVRTYRIEGGPYRAEVVSTGAALRMLECMMDDGDPAALTESWTAGEKPPLSAGLVLAPWPNRIRDGSFVFEGEAHHLEITEPARHNAIHGLVRRREWQLESHTDNAVTQSIEVGRTAGWTYPIHLTVTHELTDNGLSVTHTATNIGDTHAPFGLGVHAFLRAGDAALDECTFLVPATVRLPLDSQRSLPAGISEPVRGTDLDFREARALAGIGLDVPLGGLVPDADGLARSVLSAPDGTVAALWTDSAFRWVQVFIADPANDQAYPGRGRALAVEPMTCPPDAFNTGIDLIVLDPGQTWTGRWGIQAL